MTIEEKLIEAIAKKWEKWGSKFNDDDYLDFIRQEISIIKIDEFRKGYNQCLEDEKIPNKFGQKSL